MPITYTNVSKPTGPTYVNDNSQGREQYDQSTLKYDEVSVFYDGVNESLYTDVSKPTLPSYTNVTKPT